VVRQLLELGANPERNTGRDGEQSVRCLACAMTCPRARGTPPSRPPAGQSSWSGPVSRQWCVAAGYGRRSPRRIVPSCACPAHVAGASPLLVACQDGHLSCVEALLEHGVAHVDRPSKRGVTPLFLACAAGHTDVAQLLLFSGMIDTAATWLCVCKPDQPRVVSVAACEGTHSPPRLCDACT
jgi:hypothetical protein